MAAYEKTLDAYLSLYRDQQQKMDDIVEFVKTNNTAKITSTSLEMQMQTSFMSQLQSALEKQQSLMETLQKMI